MVSVTLLLELFIYVAASRLVVGKLSGLGREAVFAALNLGAVFWFLFYGGKSHYVARFIFYIGLITVQFIMLRLFAKREGGLPWLAFFTPILALIIVRYVPGVAYVKLGHAFGVTLKGVPELIGISYLAFRTSRLVLEVRNGDVKIPNFLEYLNFCFFLPTMSVGPINSYANYRRGFEKPLEYPIGRCVLRILVGFVKFIFLSTLLDRLSYTGLLRDDHLHHWIDLPVAMLFYYLYLYCNFSGFCDMAIGAAGLIGIAVPENFDNPMGARNVKIFWNRWHITLSQYMRDLVFAPLSKYLAGVLGPANVNHAVAISIMVVFLLIGVWHGVGWNYAAFGVAHGIGLVINHYYTVGLKKWLGRDGFKAYNDNPWIHALAVVMTFCYCAACLFLFANTFDQMKEILSCLR